VARVNAGLGPCLSALLGLLAAGCGEGPVAAGDGIVLRARSGSFLDDYRQALRSGDPAQALAVDGDWSGIAFCPSGPYPVRLTVDGSGGQATVEPALGDPRKTTPFGAEHVDVAGAVTYEPEVQRLRFEEHGAPGERGARVLHLELLLAPERPDRALLVASETGPGGRARTCTEGFLARGAPGETAREGAERLAAIREDRRAVEAGSCPEAYAAWLDRAVEAGPPALSDPAFARAFGGPVETLSSEALLSASARLGGACTTGADGRTDVARVRAAALLRDYRAYGAALRDAFVGDLPRAWGDWARARIDANAVPDGSVAVALRTVPRRFGFADHPALEGFDRAAEDAFRSLRIRDRNLDVAERIEGHRDDFRALLGIALQAGSRGDVDMAVVAAGLDYHLVGAARASAPSIDTVPDAVAAAAWVARQREGACPAADPDTCAQAAQVLERRLDTLAPRFADQEAAAFAELLEQDRGPERLRSLVAFERDFRRRYGVFAEHRAFARGVERRRDARREDQQRLADGLEAQVAQARRAPVLRALAREHFLDDELAAFPDLREAIDRVLETTRPFAELAGGAYLDALYNQDFERLRELDAYYVEGVRPLLALGAQQAALLGPVVDAVEGEPPGTSAARLSRAVQAATALYAVLGTYLVAYEDRYGQACLGPGARSITIERTTERVTRDGFGATVRREALWTERDTYRVKGAFAGQFEALFATATDDGRSLLLDLLLNDLRITRLREGTRALMARYGCASDEVLQFERGLLAYDREVRRRVR
jgi:hypothetical protein